VTGDAHLDPAGDDDDLVLREVLAWKERRLEEIEAELHAATDPGEISRLAADLALELILQYEFQGDFEDQLGTPETELLNSALACARIVISHRPDGSADPVRVPLGLAHQYLYWFADGDEREHLDVALQYLPPWIPTITDHQERAYRCYQVARTFVARFAEGSPDPEADLTSGIHLFDAVLSAPDEAGRHEEATNLRAQALTELCELIDDQDQELPALMTTTLTALDDAAALLRSDQDPGTTREAARLAEMAGRLRHRRYRLELSPPDASDLARAIEQLSTARDALAPGDDIRLAALASLAEALADRAGDHPAAHDTLEQAHCLREMLDHLPDDGDPDWVCLPLNLATTLVRQAQRRQEWLPELDELLPRLVALAPAVHDPEYQLVLAWNLGASYAVRFVSSGPPAGSSLVDAEKALTWLQRCLDSPLIDAEGGSSVHHLMGAVQMMRSTRSQGWTPHLGLDWISRLSLPAMAADPDRNQAGAHFLAARPDPTADFLLTLIRLERLVGNESQGEPSDAELRRLVEDFEKAGPASIPLSTGLGVGLLPAILLIELARRGSGTEDLDRAVTIARAMLVELTPDSPIRAVAMQSLGRALALRAERRSCLEEAVEAEQSLTRALEISTASGQQLPELREDLAQARALIASLPPEPPTPPELTVLEFERLERDVSALGTHTPTTVSAQLFVDLAEALDRRGERGRAISVAHRALLEYARAVLVSDGPDSGLAVARAGGRQVERMARRCLDADDPESAIAVLEAGRGLVLHATTLTVGVPELLRLSGHEGLAANWEGSALEPSERATILSALDSPAGIMLLAPVTVDRIGPALWAAELDALVYLVPGGPGPGAALLVGENGEVDHVRLPLLRHVERGPVAELRDARREAFLDRRLDELDPAHDPALRRWHDALEQASEWAHAVAIGPLLEFIGGWGRRRRPRLGLVPTASLTMVPWHAARHRTQGEVRYACQDALFSYAASARQLMDCTRRRRLPLNASAVFVANPSGTQIWPSISAAGAREVFYPGADYFGYPASLSGRRPGTPEQVLARFASTEQDGASMLQLSSHASVHDSSTRSSFELAHGARLTVAQILARARGRHPDAPGGLVICDSCMTDLTEDDHDEVLTLGTAFLAAGAVSVIGARWPLDDRMAAVMTFVLHHHLSQGLGPADALHRTQLWMLDPDRPVLSTMPIALAREAHRPELADLASWAALIHQGQ